MPTRREDEKESEAQMNEERLRQILEDGPVDDDEVKQIVGINGPKQEWRNANDRSFAADRNVFA